MLFYKEVNVLRKLWKASLSGCSRLIDKTSPLVQFRISDDYFSAVNKLKTLLLVLWDSNPHRSPPGGVTLVFSIYCFNDTNPSPDSFLLMSGQRTRQICNIQFLKSRFGKKMESGYNFTLVSVLLFLFHQTIVYENFNLIV